jgi:hypothetical protein
MVSLLLDFLHAPELLAVRDEMTELMRGIEAGTDTVILVRAEDDDWAVGEGNAAAPCQGRLANGAGPVWGAAGRLAGYRVNVPRRRASPHNRLRRHAQARDQVAGPARHMLDWSERFD